MSEKVAVIFTHKAGNGKRVCERRVYDAAAWNDPIQRAALISHYSCALALTPRARLVNWREV